MGKSQNLYKKARTLIPGGTQLLSKRPEMFLPEFWPAYYEKASGCEIWDLDGNRYIDILALDKENNYVIIELKVSRGYDRVVGQILRYMAWIKKNHADENQNVRGIIIAREISEDLLLACSTIPNIDLYEYKLSVSLDKVNH